MKRRLLTSEQENICAAFALGLVAGALTILVWVLVAHAWL